MSDNQRVFAEIGTLASGSNSREERARQIADVIRLARGYRWAGIYQVTQTEIVALGWTGAEAPAYSTFPLHRGLSGQAVKNRATVVCSDTTKEVHYVAFFSQTRSEIIVPVLETGGAVVGTIDVDSDHVNAFSQQDQQFLELCAARILPLFSMK